MSQSRHPLGHARIGVLALALASTVALSGCATTASSKVAASTHADFYPTCYQPVRDLRQSDQKMKDSVKSGALAGGIFGALAGAVSGDDEDAGRNALIGAAVGATAGGFLAYHNEKQKQIADDRARIASYSTDLDRSASDMDRSIGYASAAQACYQKEFTALVEARKAKTIGDNEGRRRLAEIVSGLKESNALMAAVDGRIGENIDTYAQAYEKDLEEVGVQRVAVSEVAQAEIEAEQPKPPTSKKTTPQPARKMAHNVPKEAVQTERTLQKAKLKRAESQQVAARGKGMVSDVCSNPDMGDWAPASCASS